MSGSVKAARVNSTIEEITEHNIESILCSEDASRNKSPLAYRLVSRIAAATGTVGFLWANVLFFAAWVGFNMLGPAFDPYPFTFLLFGVSLEAIFLSILILISQNMAAVENERRHHLDLQMNLLSEREVTAMMRLMVQMAGKLGISEEEQAEVRKFAHDTDPSGVLSQIVKAERRHNVPEH